MATTLETLVVKLQADVADLKGGLAQAQNSLKGLDSSVSFGFDSYIAVIGPTVEYARAVELGSPRWKSGVKYPYLEPAAIALIKSGKINRIFVGAIKSKLGRG